LCDPCDERFTSDMLVSLVVMSAANLFLPLKTDTRNKTNCCVLYCMSASKM
jgi:hypothetical protein